MNDPLRPPMRQANYRGQINRAHSPVLAGGTPWATIMLGSLAPVLPVIPAVPVLPPLGFLLLLGWRLVRPGLLPLWAGVPLGLFDDLFSGQPFVHSGGFSQKANIPPNLSVILAQFKTRYLSRAGSRANQTG